VSGFHRGLRLRRMNDRFPRLDYEFGPRGGHAARLFDVADNFEVGGVGLGAAVTAAGEGGGDEFGREGGEVVLAVIDAVIDAEFVGPVGVDVAGEDDGVGDLMIANVFEELLALGGIAGPLVHGVGGGLAHGVTIDQGHHHLLGEDVPSAGRGFE
jgi:hypothetical protein